MEQSEVNKYLIKNNVSGEWDLVSEYVFNNARFTEEYAGESSVIILPSKEMRINGTLTGQDIAGIIRFFQLPNCIQGSKIHEPETVKISRGNSCVMHHIKTGENWVRKSQKKSVATA